MAETRTSESPIHGALRRLRALGLRREYGRWRLSVPPQAIEYRRRKYEWPRYVRSWPFFLCPGGWDAYKRLYRPFQEALIHQLFIEGRAPEDTDTYYAMHREICEQGRTQDRRLTSVAELDAYFVQLKALYRSMKAGGYRMREGEALHTERELTVRIGRDGHLIKCGEGTHRHALALLLEIPRVAVVVDLVHMQWAFEQLRRRSALAPEPALQEGLQALAGWWSENGARAGATL